MTTHAVGHWPSISHPSNQRRDGAIGMPLGGVSQPRLRFTRNRYYQLLSYHSHHHPHLRCYCKPNRYAVGSLPVDVRGRPNVALSADMTAISPVCSKAPQGTSSLRAHAYSTYRTARQKQSTQSTHNGYSNACVVPYGGVKPLYTTVCTPDGGTCQTPRKTHTPQPWCFSWTLVPSYSALQR